MTGMPVVIADRTASPPDGRSITISVVSHGHGRMISTLLGDLARVPILRGAQVIVTFNIPEAEPLELAYDGLTIIPFHNPAPQGFGANHNAAFALARSDLFLVINPDARVPPEGFARLLEPFADARTGLVVPRVINSTGTREDALRDNLSPWSIVARRLGAPEMNDRAGLEAVRSERFFWAAGMFMLFRSQTFAALKGFDTRFHMYCEDYDICARLWLSGWTLCPIEDYAIIHDAQRATGQSYRHLRWHLASMFRVWRSRPFWAISLREVRRRLKT